MGVSFTWSGDDKPITKNKTKQNKRIVKVNSLYLKKIVTLYAFSSTSAEFPTVIHDFAGQDLREFFSLEPQRLGRGANLWATLKKTLIQRQRVRAACMALFEELWTISIEEFHFQVLVWF